MRKILILVACIAGLGMAQTAAAQIPRSFELAIVDMKGNRKVLGTLPGSVFAPRVSPDGKTVAFELADAAAGPASGQQAARLQVADLDKLDKRRAMPVTPGRLTDWAPIWSPDGQQLVYLSQGNGPDALFSRSADGSGEPQHLLDARAAEGMYQDGRQLAFITLTGNRDYGISLLDMNTRAVTQLVDYPNSEQHSSRISPDGRWIAYVSNETGRQEVWLAALPQSAVRYRLTENGGRHPEWSPDGEKLFFDQDGQIFRFDVFAEGDVPKVSKPVALPIKGFQQGDLRRQYDLMPDGKSFIMLFPVP
jgi:Tol biopolymer transport system component